MRSGRTRTSTSPSGRRRPRSSSGSRRSASRPRCSWAATSSFMKRVSEETGLQVVPCTGIYTYDHLPQFFMNRDPDQIAELFVSDIEQGIQGTEIKAAFIKCAADEPGVNENIEKIHRAAARASLKTGAPIMAHSRPASNTGPAPGRDLRGGGRRSLEGPDRPHRRHRRPRLHRGPAREGRLDRPRPLRPRSVPAVREAPGDGEGAARARLRGADLPLGRLGRDHRLVPAERDRAAASRRERRTTGRSGSSPRRSCRSCARPA